MEICQKEDVHGMGYKPLQEIGVLSEKYGRVTASLKKTNCSGKGIRGQVNNEFLNFNGWLACPMAQRN